MINVERTLKKEANKTLLKDQLEDLRTYVKDSLWELGYGSNQHLHLLYKDIYFENRARRKYPYLFKILKFYHEVLDRWEKRYFVNEVLEKGEHYLFWHSDMSSRVYGGYEKKTLRKIKDGLFDEATPF